MSVVNTGVRIHCDDAVSGKPLLPLIDIFITHTPASLEFLKSLILFLS